MNMKPSLLTLSLSLFFFAFPFTFSTAADQVLDTHRNPISPGVEYYLIPAVFGPTGGGVKLDSTGNSVCPVTVLQDNSEIFRGISVKFKIPDVSVLKIYTGTQLEIEFTWKPECTKSSKWIVFLDNAIGKACVGIGGAEDHPGEQTFNGTFSIEKYNLGYKFVFCVGGSSTCMDIGRYDNDEGGSRLSLTEHRPFGFDFVHAATHESTIETDV